MRIKCKRRGRRGFTLVELILSMTVLAVLVRILVGATSSLGSMAEVGNLEARIHRSSEQAMNWILRDLRNSGFQVVDGRDYPHILDGGVGTDGFEAYTYVPAPSGATAGDPNFGPTKGIVLCLPSDLDGNGRPEMDADGDGIPELDGNHDGTPSDAASDVAGIWGPTLGTINSDTRLVWGHDDITYAVVVGPTGENELVRLIANGAGGRRVIARSVDRVEFDTIRSAGGVGFPSDSIRVRIYFRVLDSEGHAYRSRHEAVVQLKNSDLGLAASRALGNNNGGFGQN